MLAKNKKQNNYFTTCEIDYSSYFQLGPHKYGGTPNLEMAKKYLVGKIITIIQWNSHDSEDLIT